MRKILILSVYILGIFIVSFILSCEKNKIVKNNEEINDITQEVEKIETIYKKGDVKVEGFDPSYTKIETDASESLKNRIKANLEESYSKRIVLKNGGNSVGVIKSGSCGSHGTLEIHMDCEDSSPNTSKSGWVGDNWVGGNVTLRFCIVDATYFDKTGADYALLVLSSSSSMGNAKHIMRYFDNEDNSNDNWAKVNGSSHSGWFGNCHFAHNTRLSFYYYTKQGSSRTFPYIGIHYGVFGRFGSSQGSIYFDDEDKGNANLAYIDGTPTGHIPNIMNVGRNTRLYMSYAR